MGGGVIIDDVVKVPVGSKIFVKMDVEGAEPEALKGGRLTFTQNKVRASICSYHNADDAVKIKSIFQSYGYKTATSAGYMVFLWGKDFWETADFRKGVVYAENY